MVGQLNNRKMKKIKNTKEAIDVFIDAATKHTTATLGGDYKTCNKNYDKMANVVDYLKKENALYELEDLLNSKNVGVRTCAAAYLISVDSVSKKCQSVLSEISHTEGIGILQFNAEMVLKEWECGRLKL